MNTLSVGRGDDRLADEFALGGHALADARELREALRAACRAHAGQDMSPAARDTLNRLLSAAPLVVAVDDEGSAALAPADPAPLVSRVAAAVATAMAEGTWQRLKACEAEDCHEAYYDRSPAGRSRWCTMAVCGSRAKMRAYRARAKPAPSGTRAAPRTEAKASPSGD